MGTLLFGRVYSQAQEHLSALVQALVTMLEDFGCGNNNDAILFSHKVRQVLLTLATVEDTESPLVDMRVEGSTQEKRATLIREVLIGFGESEREANSLAQQVLNADPNLITHLSGDGGVAVEHSRDWRLLSARILHLHRDAVELHGRLKDVLDELAKPFRGTPENPGPGIEQVVDLFQKFPDVADAIYQRSDLEGIRAFPPQETGGANGDALVFKQEVEAYLDSQWWWNTIKLAGLIVAAVTITVVTAGAFSPAAAALLGSGIGLAQGAVQINNAQNRLVETRDAQRFGAATEDTVEFAKGEVQGAWGMLLIDVASGGLIGRFGGSGAVSGLMRGVRVTALSAAQGGLSTAVNPNVWRSENTAGLILYGTVIGGAGGLGGHVIASGAGRLIRPLGANVQIGVSQVDGPLTQGNTVKLQLSAGDTPVNATVLSINQNDNTVMLKVQGQNLHVRVGQIAKLEASILDNVHGLRPATANEIAPGFTHVSLARPNGTAVRGMVEHRPNGANPYVFYAAGSQTPRPVALTELRMYDAGVHTNTVQAMGVPAEDFAAFQPHQGAFDVSPVAGDSAFYAARPQSQYGHSGAQLYVLNGASHDHNGAFNNWYREGLPNYRMNGRGPAPAPNEVALFMAHGSPFGFGGMNTRTAARTTVDAIVHTNQTAPAGTAPIRFCSLSSCSQGTRRFVIMGKTNAESFQQHVDLRLSELGIDPNGSQGITVLASDRMGSLYGADYVKVNGKFVKTDFVPAGTQRPFSYTADVAQLGVSGLKLAGIIVAAQGTVILGVEAYRDPEGTMQWLRDNADKVLGIIVEGTSSQTPWHPPMLAPASGQ